MSTEKLDAPTEAVVRAYYKATIPLIAAAIGRVPFTSVFCLQGLNGGVTRARAATPPLRHGVDAIDVPQASGPRSYLLFNETAAWWCLYRHAVAFESWAPTEGDPTRARLAHLLLAPVGNATETMLREAARAIRNSLAHDGLDAIPVLDGAGMTLWIPLAGGPRYDHVRGYLRAVIARAMEAEPDLLSIKPFAESAGRIHVWIGSNAVGQGCNLPYCLRACEGLLVVTPVAWQELETCANGDFRADNFAQRLAGVGDRFAEALAALGDQRLPHAAPEGEYVELRAYDPRSRWLAAAFEVLADGRPRTADEIFAEAVKRDLLPAGLNHVHMASQLTEYLNRMLARGARPRVVQDEDYRWRINHPIDDWPTIEPAKPPPLEPLLEELHRTKSGQPEAFEKAVLAIFEWLGFAATHLGGNDKPDGYLDAPLGPLRYRVLVECKTGTFPAKLPDVWEASEHKADFRADFCMLIYPEVARTTRVTEESKTHGVGVWTVADLATVATRRLDLWTARALFEPGIVSDSLEDLLWELDHGKVRRIRTLAAIIAEEGWRAQCGAVNSTGDAPSLTIDAAMFLVDGRLRAEGSVIAATRSEIDSAFAHLCDPVVNAAQWLDKAKGAIAIVRRPAAL